MSTKRARCANRSRAWIGHNSGRARRHRGPKRAAPRSLWPLRPRTAAEFEQIAAGAEADDYAFFLANPHRRHYERPSKPHELEAVLCRDELAGRRTLGPAIVAVRYNPTSQIIERVFIPTTSREWDSAKGLPYWGTEERARRSFDPHPSYEEWRRRTAGMGEFKYWFDTPYGMIVVGDDATHKWLTVHEDWTYRDQFHGAGPAFDLKALTWEPR